MQCKAFPADALSTQESHRSACSFHPARKPGWIGAFFAMSFLSYVKCPSIQRMAAARHKWPRQRHALATYTQLQPRHFFPVQMMQPLMRVNPSARSLSGNKARIVPLEPRGKRERKARGGERKDAPPHPRQRQRVNCVSVSPWVKPRAGC